MGSLDERVTALEVGGFFMVSMHQIFFFWGGKGKTSVTDIAKALNVSHGTIYRHFKNKAELMEVATEKWLHEKIIASLSLIYEEKGKHGPEHLKKYIQRLIELKRSDAHQDKELFEMYAKVTEESSES